MSSKIHSVNTILGLESQETRKYQENLKIKWRQSLVLTNVLLPEIKLYLQQPIIAQKQISKFFGPVDLCLISLLCFIIFFRDCLWAFLHQVNFYVNNYLFSFLKIRSSYPDVFCIKCTLKYCARVPSLFIVCQPQKKLCVV